MTAQIYLDGRAIVVRQLAPEGSNPDAKGQVVTLTFVTAGAYQPGGSVTGGGSVTQTCSGVEKSINTNRIDGKNILHGDVEFRMSPVTTSGADLQLPPITNGALPADTTLTLANGEVWRVADVDAKRPSGLLIAVSLQLRR